MHSAVASFGSSGSTSTLASPLVSAFENSSRLTLPSPSTSIFVKSFWICSSAIGRPPPGRVSTVRSSGSVRTPSPFRSNLAKAARSFVSASLGATSTRSCFSPGSIAMTRPCVSYSIFTTLRVAWYGQSGVVSTRVLSSVSFSVHFLPTRFFHHMLLASFFSSVTQCQSFLPPASYRWFSYWPSIASIITPAATSRSTVDMPGVMPGVQQVAHASPLIRILIVT